MNFELLNGCAFLGTPLILTAITTAWVCRFNIVRGKRLSTWPGVLLACTFTILSWLFFMGIFVAMALGPRAFVDNLGLICTQVTNQLAAGIFDSMLGLLLLNSFFSLAVVWLYQRKRQGSEN